MLKLIDYRRGQFAHAGHGALIGQIIAAFDRVEGVPFGRVVASVGGVPQCRIEAALRGAGMRTERVYLGDNGYVPVRTQTYCGPQACQAPADHQNIVSDHVATQEK